MGISRHLLVYSFIKNFKKDWRSADFWKSIFIRLYFFSFRWYFLKNSKSIFQEDWDNLIILDACRYDSFKKNANNKCKKLKPFYSMGTHTSEFLKNNFKSPHKDVIYITGNPFCDVIKNKVFKLIPVWKEFWNKEYNTVLPKDMVKISIVLKQKYQDKRFIVHFMQPHHPFVKSKKIYKITNKFKEKFPNEISDPWHLSKKGYIKEKELWKAYEDNLKLVLPYAIKLANHFKIKYKQKTVITADHGNAFKKIKFPFNYLIAGHPYGIYIDDLIKVPWCEIY